MLDSLVGHFLEEARRTNGWNSAELAAHAGISPETMSRIKGGCHFDTVERLAAALGMRIIAVPDNDHVQDVLSRGSI